MTTGDERLRVARRVLTQSALASLQKADSELFFSESGVAKFIRIRDGEHWGRILSEVARLSSVPETETTTLERISPTECVVVMPRLPEAHNAACALASCKCDDPVRHVALLYETVRSADRPPRAIVASDHVARAMSDNANRQIASIGHEFPPALIRSARAAVGELIRDWHTSAPPNVQLDGHGNLFATNVWTLPSGPLAIDQSSSPHTRSFPDTVDFAAAMVDVLLLHETEDPTSTHSVVVHALDQVDSINRGLLTLAMMTKILVRWRFANDEIELRDDLGTNRSLDVRVVDRARSAAELTLNAISLGRWRP